MAERLPRYLESENPATEPGIEDLDPIQEVISPYSRFKILEGRHKIGCSRCEYSWKVGRKSMDVAFRCDHPFRPVRNRFMAGSQKCELWVQKKDLSG